MFIHSQECQGFNYFDIWHSSAITNIELVLAVVIASSSSCCLDAVGFSDSTMAPATQ